MAWLVDPLVTIGGTDFTANTLKNATIRMGRGSFWEQPRAGYATINLVNQNNSAWAIDINQSVVIKVKDSSGTLVTLFTGKVNSVSNSVASAGSTANVVTQTITAIGPMAQMARTIMSGTFAKELDSVRLNSILTAAGVTVDVVDSPGVYEFQSITQNDNDCYAFGSKYAQMAFGYIYETASGKIGYANEARRKSYVTTNGYLTIPGNTILGRSVGSTLALSDLTNDVSLTYRSGTVNQTSSGSITNYGRAEATITTELHNFADATYQAERYVTLRSTPQTNLSSFTVQLDASTVSDTLLDKLLAINLDLGILVTGLPNGILNGNFDGFVENYIFSIAENQVALTIGASDATFSLAPTRWQDVSAALQWQSVGATIQWQQYD